MTIHHMKLAKDPFEKIASGKKVIESRLFDEKRRLIDIGDEIEFSRHDDPERTVKAGVVALHRYDSFGKLFSDFPPESFGGTSEESLLTEISRLYSEEKQEKYGVIGIRIELRK